jgi:hypothetical protein
MNPELYDPERFGIRVYRPTKQSNCSPLGMVVYEVSVDAIASVAWMAWNLRIVRLFKEMSVTKASRRIKEQWQIQS